MPMNIINLPTEILDGIMNYCDLISWFAFKYSCNKAYNRVTAEGEYKVLVSFFDLDFIRKNYDKDVDSINTPQGLDRLNHYRTFFLRLYCTDPLAVQTVHLPFHPIFHLSYEESFNLTSEDSKTLSKKIETRTKEVKMRLEKCAG